MRIGKNITLSGSPISPRLHLHAKRESHVVPRFRQSMPGTLMVLQPGLWRSIIGRFKKGDLQENIEPIHQKNIQSFELPDQYEMTVAQLQRLARVFEENPEFYKVVQKNRHTGKSVLNAVPLGDHSLRVDTDEIFIPAVRVIDYSLRVFQKYLPNAEENFLSLLQGVKNSNPEMAYWILWKSEEFLEALGKGRGLTSQSKMDFYLDWVEKHGEFFDAFERGMNWLVKEERDDSEADLMELESLVWASQKMVLTPAMTRKVWQALITYRPLYQGRERNKDQPDSSFSGLQRKIHWLRDLNYLALERGGEPAEAKLSIGTLQKSLTHPGRGIRIAAQEAIDHLREKY